VTILGNGDLVPRRRRRPIGRYLATLVVLALVAGGGYAGYRTLQGGSSTPTSSAANRPVCHAPTTSVLFAPAHQVRLSVMNASLRTGLAAQVEHELKHRGFRVTQIGNALRVGHDVATVQYSSDQERAASTVAAQIPGGPTMKPVAGRRVLELDIGVRFARLRSAPGARALERHRLATVSPAPTPTPSSCTQAGAAHAGG
jgi:acetolactate synthase regulatory subunit